MKTIELNVKQSEILQPQNAVIDNLEISLRHSKSLQIIACDDCSLRHHLKPINRLNAWWQETTLLSESALQLYLANCMITTDSSKTPRDFYNYFFIFICNRPRQSLIKRAPGWVVYSAHIRFVQCELRHSSSICNYSAISLNFRQIFWLCMFFGWFNRWSMKEIFRDKKISLRTSLRRINLFSPAKNITSALYIFSSGELLSVIGQKTQSSAIICFNWTRTASNFSLARQNSLDFLNCDKARCRSR